MDGIDTSIYGNLQPPQQPNMLGMGMQAAYMANAMNQNRMFQMQMQARTGLAEIAQHHANPDGTVDYEGILSDMFKDPRTAMMAPQWGQNMAQQGLLNMETLNERQKLWRDQNDAMYSALAPIFPKIQAGTATQEDAFDALARGLSTGLYTGTQAMNLLQMMPPDKKDANGNVVGNPELNQHLWGLVQAWKGSRDAWNNFTGTIQSFQTPQGMEIGTYSPGTGQYTHLGQVGFGTPYESTDTIGQKTPIPQNQIPGFGGSLWNPAGGGGNPYGYTSGQSPGVASPGSMSTGPINNPGNIRSGEGGSFGNYPTPGAGIDAIDKNLQAYGHKGINTLAGVISTWAPPNENPTAQLIANASKRLGVDPNAPLDLSNPNVREQVALAIIQQEQGPIRAGQPQGGGGGFNPQAAATAVPGSATMAPNLTQSQFAGARQEQAALQQQLAGEPQAQGAGAQPNANQAGVVTPTQGQMAQIPPGMTTQQGQGAQAPGQGQDQPASSGYTFTPQEQQALGMTPGKKVVSSLPPLIDDFNHGKGLLADYQNQYQSTQASDNQSNLSMNEMSRLLNEFKAGRGETAFSEIARVAQTLGMDDKLVSAISRGDLDAVQEFQKLAVPNAVNVARVTEGPNSKLTNMISGAFLATQPNLEMTPGAITRMFNFMGKIQQLHNTAYQYWTQEVSRMRAAAAQNGAWTPQMLARLQNFPAAFEQGLIEHGLINFNFDKPNLIDVGPPKGQP